MIANTTVVVMVAMGSAVGLVLSNHAAAQLCQDTRGHDPFGQQSRRVFASDEPFLCTSTALAESRL